MPDRPQPPPRSASQLSLMRGASLRFLQRSGSQGSIQRSGSQRSTLHVEMKEAAGDNGERLDRKPNSSIGGFKASLYRVVRHDSSPVDDDEMELRVISLFRRLITLFMLILTIGAGVGTYFFLEQKLDDEIQYDLDIIVEDMRLLSQERISTLVADTQGLALTLATLAKHSKSEWPYHTESNFPLIAANYMRATGTHMVLFSPILRNETECEKWSSYSQSNRQWIADGIRFEEETEPILFDGESSMHYHHHHHQVNHSNHGDHGSHGDHSNHGSQYAIFPKVYKFTADGDKVAEDSPGPFVPSWQMAAAPRIPSIVNYNLLSNEHFADVFNMILETRSPTLTDILGKSMLDWEQFMEENGHQHSDAPYNMLLCPVYRDTSNEEIVAVVMSDMNWLPIFALASDEKTPLVDVVVDEGCDQKFTLQISGTDVSFVGFDDFHDTEFDAYRKSFPFSPDLPSVHVAGSECSYNVHVYPTREFREAYDTDNPMENALKVGGAFLTMCLIFYLYDFAVNRHQKRITKVASRSENILSVLYPKNVRDRLFGKVAMNEDTVDTAKDDGSSEFMKATKYQLMSFLGSTPSMGLGADFDSSKPIADLFLETTVFFGDIAGFTSWSSVREPSQVFTLLESVYRSFDTIAKDWNVFKVETVGDCYVAVTGLPEPADDHAVAMGEFARECIERFAQLVGSLETTLGPDTSDLGIRIGLHSGPVTAGVLRGDKSRFQLFGDTVNTCSRIESTGIRNRIQVSEDTAKLLKEAGKSNWLKERENMVSAKGKGKLRTHWLLTRQEEKEQATLLREPSAISLAPKEEEEQQVFSREPSFQLLSNSSSNAMFASALNASSFKEVEKSLSPRLRRLCHWNGALLSRLLKQIVAHRDASPSRESEDSDDDGLSRLEQVIRQDYVVLDEVVDIIALPPFDPVVYKRKKNVDEIVLSKDVEDQILLFVVCIAEMYHDNPFHNFDHASHVMMSVSKLLSRIVGVKEVLDVDENAAVSENFGWSIHDHTYGITSDPMTQFSVVLAALVHDIDHLGVSNAQLVKEGHKLADRFKKKSVAEQNSTVLAWELLMDSRFDDFRRTIYADQFELKRFRQLMANTVLATDIMDKELQALRRNRWKSAFDPTNIANLGTAMENVNRKATIVIEHLIQASDVSHTMQHWHVYCKWNERLFKEMTLAYKAGRLGFDPAEKWYEGEIGFLDNYVIPLAKKLKDCGVFGVSSDEYLNYAMENRVEWEEKGRGIVAAMVQKYNNEEEETLDTM